MEVTLLAFFILLTIGLILLWKSGSLAVRHAVAFSLIYNVESFTVGFIIFAISTGFPEIVSSIVSTIQGVPELAAGDLLGSTFVNLSMILGVTLIYAGKINIEKTLKKRIVKTIVLMVVIYYGIFAAGKITVLSGLLLIVLYLGSLFGFRGSLPEKEVSKEIKEVKEETREREQKAKIPAKVVILFKLLGSLGLMLISAWITVRSAKEIVESLDLNLPLFGATLIAVGTGLPELVLQLHSIKDKQHSLALGNIFGSSLLNISLILGLLGLMNPGLDLTFVKIIIPFFSLAILIFAYKLFYDKPAKAMDGYLLLLLFFLYIGVAGYWQVVPMQA